MCRVVAHGAVGELHGAEAVDEAAARFLVHHVVAELGVARDQLGVFGNVHAAAVGRGVAGEGAAGHLHRPALQGRAAARVGRRVAHDRDVGHRERVGLHVNVDAGAVLRLVAHDQAAVKRRLAVGAEPAAEVARLVFEYGAAFHLERAVAVQAHTAADVAGLVPRNGARIEVQGSADVQAAAPLRVASRNLSQAVGYIVDEEGRVLRDVEYMAAVLVHALVGKAAVDLVPGKLDVHHLVFNLQARVAALGDDVVLQADRRGVVVVGLVDDLLQLTPAAHPSAGQNLYVQLAVFYLQVRLGAVEREVLDCRLVCSVEPLGHLARDVLRDEVDFRAAAEAAFLHVHDRVVVKHEVLALRGVVVFHHGSARHGKAVCLDAARPDVGRIALDGAAA